jgi:hypothetical protein
MGARAARAATVLSALALAACGGSGHTAAKGPPAVRVCTAAASAAGRALGSRVKFSITDKDPVNIECALSGSGVKLAVTAQASSQAYTAWNIATTHFEQAFGAFGHTQHPQTFPGLGTVAQWFPAQQQFLTTNGTPSRGGTFVTIAVTHWASPATSRVSVARAVAQRVLAVAPRGPNPGAPPS